MNKLLAATTALTGQEWKFPKAVQRNMAMVFSEIYEEREAYFQKRRWARLYEVKIQTIEQILSQWGVDYE